jgi:signal peptidase II
LKLLSDTRFQFLVFFLGYISDQITKFWAVARFTDANGEQNYQKINVIGDLFRFQLAYNEGAAFSMKPQALLPFLHPTLFFSIVSIIAITGLIWFYRTLPTKDWPSRLGVMLILSGALGNLTDRMHIHKVVDFIDVDFPDFIMHRWPTFNIADSCVCVGVSLILISPVLFKKPKTEVLS